MSDRSGSWRTCVGCREKGRPDVLLRVVANPTGDVEGSARDVVMVVPDPKRRTPGRGAWIHPDSECLQMAQRRRAFARALRVRTGAIDTQQLQSYLSDQAANTESAG
ncbi:MAG: YlxR family protein [Actinomycetota bacterium]|nr:YlxR family protein [Actinomycetota bacterium]